MSFVEREIANELRVMYKNLSVYESLQIAVGVRKNDLFEKAFDIGRRSSVMPEIAGQLGSIASSILANSEKRE